MIRPAVLNCCQSQRNSITMIHVSFVILLCLLPQAKSGECDEYPRDTFKWKGNTAKAIDDCDILRPKMKVLLHRLTNKPNCLTEVNVKIYTTEQVFFELYTPGNRRFVETTNFVPQSERCKASRVEISTMVHSSGPSRRYETTFFLQPNNCMIPEDVNFDKDCSGEVEGTEPTTVTPNQTGTNQTTGKPTSRLPSWCNIPYHFRP